MELEMIESAITGLKSDHYFSSFRWEADNSTSPLKVAKMQGYGRMFDQKTAGAKSEMWDTFTVAMTISASGSPISRA